MMGVFDVLDTIREGPVAWKAGVGMKEKKLEQVSRVSFLLPRPAERGEAASEPDHTESGGQECQQQADEPEHRPAEEEQQQHIISKD
jgi:hypothetical protein